MTFEFARLLCAIFMSFSLLLVHTNGSDPNSDFGMVIDAGSTGSRLQVYQFEDRVTSTNEPPQSSPNQIASSPKPDPGPIGFLTSQDQSDALISTLTSFAKSTLSEEEYRWNTFPIYLKATAGMRVLSVPDRERILGYIEKSFSNTSINPFLFDTTYAIIASGEEEATFDWLGVNYIYNKLNVSADDDRATYGALDLGGQSTQIAFAPEPGSNILADFTAVRLWEKTHRLYTHSFLQYGTNAIEQRVAQLVYDEMNNDSNITYNGCLNDGVNITYTIDLYDGTYLNNTQHGNSGDDPFLCRSIIRKLLANNTKCFVTECSFNGVYQAEIPENMTFIAFSAFGYAINGLHLSDNIDLYELYYNDTVDICNMNISQLKASKYNTSDSYEFINTYCRLNTYIYTLLHEGYGFRLRNTPIIFGNKYNDITITWTQGSILRDSNWLSYDLKYITNDDLSSEGKMWRTLSITLGTIVVVVLLGFIYVLYRARKGATDKYQNMEM